MRSETIRDLEHLLGRRATLERQACESPTLESRTRALRRWQAARLARTYADLRRDPRFQAATEFFLSDLYGDGDFGARDRQLARAWRYFKLLLPGAALRALRRAIELDVLTRELDQEMLAALSLSTLSEDSYAHAYRKVGRRDARERQIALVTEAGEALEQAVRQRGMGALLKASRATAHAAGFGFLHDFLTRGFRAFDSMPDAGEFLATIHARETALMEALLAGADT